MLYQAAALVALAGAVAAKPCHTSTPTVEWETAYTASASADVAAAAATAKTLSPTSSVKGKVFDRYVSIWFENTDFEKAKADPGFQYFAQKGITLDGFYAVTHPSQPNYIAAICGDYFGMNHDDFSRVDFNVSTVIDLLETKGISWGYYQEDMPYSGYEGYEWLNQEDGSNDYVRKHNPSVIFDKISHYEDKLAAVKNLSMIDRSRSQFHTDLDNNELPQWMFITPNMTSDAHDADISVAGTWLKDFLAPLLEDKNFMQNTLVLITFDENETYAERNQIFSILVGDVVPENLVGTVDSSYYNHYSEIATVEANWDLPTLGRFDVGANVYKMVGDLTGKTIREWSADSNWDGHYFNQSYAGYFNKYGGNAEYPAPNLELNGFEGTKILAEVKKTWAGSQNPTYYEGALELPDGINYPAAYSPLPSPTN